MIMEKRILEKLKLVLDPELGLDIVSLGFIRGITVNEDRGSAKIIMTLTTPLCPMRNQISDKVKKQVKDIGLKEVTVEYIFDPPWEPPPEIKAILGF